MLTETLRADYPVAFDHAIDVLKHSGLVAFPTDTVYGLAVMPFDAPAIESLFTAKGRNSSRLVGVLLGAMEQVPGIALPLNEMEARLAHRFWPGALTLLLRAKPGLPADLAPNGAVAVRMPAHPIALELLRRVGPLAVTAATLIGREHTLNAAQVYSQLKGRIHLILDGGTVPGGQPSTVIDCSSGTVQLLREGPLSLESVLQGQ